MSMQPGQIDDEERIRSLARQLASSTVEKRDFARSDEGKSALAAALARYSAPGGYLVGDLVVWKDGLKNRRIPEYGEPCIVVEILDPPNENPAQESGSQYFREMLTLKIGQLDDDRELVFWHLDGSRMTKFLQ